MLKKVNAPLESKTTPPVPLVSFMKKTYGGMFYNIELPFMLIPIKPII
jgi:hypothetical protein